MKFCRRDQPAVAVVNWSYIDRFDYMDSHTGEWQCLLPGDRASMAENYYKYLNSQFIDKWKSLSYVKMAQDHLDRCGIPFVMTYMDHLLLENQFHTGPAVELLQIQVGEYLSTFKGKNFLEWSRENGHAISKAWNHPLDSAHTAAAEFWLPVVSDLVNKINKRS
jgi:hypothetical protein